MPSVANLPDYLLSIGRYWITSTEAAELTGQTKAKLAPGIQRLRRSNKLFSPSLGFYVVVPPEYRSWGVLPGELFIDGLMKAMNRSYYVSLLTAAAMHGAGHQAPQVFQVMVDRAVRDRDINRVRLRFFTSEYINDDCFEELHVQTGRFRLASREATLVDLIEHPNVSGGFSNIATIVKEIGEIDTRQLADLTTTRSRSVSRRLGWFLQEFRGDLDLEPLREIAMPQDGFPTRLMHSLPGTGRIDARWNLQINSPVEPDL